MRFASSWVLAWMLTAGACSGEARTRVDSEVNAPTFDSVSLVGYVREYLSMPSATNYVGGVRVCQHEPRLCTETSETGTWMLDGLEPGREILLTFEKTGYFTTYQPMVTPQFSSVILRFLSIVPNNGDFNEPLNEARVAAGLAPLEESSGLSSISFSAFVGSDALYIDSTIHVRLNPDTGIAPMYVLAPDNEISPVIPEGKVASFGIFPNVPPGDDYELEYTMDDGECTRGTGEWSGWPAKDGRKNVIRVAVGADATTYETMPDCVRNHDTPMMEE